MSAPTRQGDDWGVSRRLDIPSHPAHAARVAQESESAVDQLWREYSVTFREFDDLTLARWMAQTLGQLAGRAWRLSHPLVGAYRLAAQVGHERGIWLKRLATAPAAYSEAPCCRAPILSLLTRDVRDHGLLCQHCGDTLTPFDELPPQLQPGLADWAAAYQPVHAVAHWDERQQKSARNYDKAFEEAAEKAEELLAHAGRELAPQLAEHYPAVVWEDQDECLEVRPEDVVW